MYNTNLKRKENDSSKTKTKYTTNGFPYLMNFTCFTCTYS